MTPRNPPRLSIVVVIVSDTVSGKATASQLANCLESLSTQRAAQEEVPSMEILVPHYTVVEGLDAVKRRFPDVRFLAVDDLKTYTGLPGNREHHDELRARGLAEASGEIIALLEDHARVDPQWCARISHAHRQAYAVIGGAIENGLDLPLNWAVYFCDFFRYQNPLPEGPSGFASDANSSYKRSALESIRPIWQEVFHETAVNGTLLERGETIALSPGIVVYQNRQDLQTQAALRERFVWGRSYASTRSHLVSTASRVIYAALSPVLPLVLTLRIGRSAFSKNRGAEFLKAAPALVLLTAAWSFGEMAGYLTGTPSAGGSHAGKSLAKSGSSAH